MGQLPPIFKEVNNPDSPRHLGRILGGMKPLCRKFPESEMDLIGWVSSRDWNPNESFCPECAGLYGRGLAWKLSSSRE